MKTKIGIQRIARKHGGLFIGFKFHFPVTVQFIDGGTTTAYTLAVGLLTHQLRIDVYLEGSKKHFC